MWAIWIFVLLLVWKSREPRRPAILVPKNHDSIPMNIFQTHKSLNYILGNDALTRATKSWKQHKSFDYYFYDDEQMDVFMKTLYQGTSWYDAYNRLQKRVMKTDFWRYCVVFEYGGIYADVDTICLKDPRSVFINSRTQNKQLVTVHENDKNMFCQWVFAAPRESPVIRSVIDVMTKRILEAPEKQIQSPTEQEVFDLTGPVIFTEGIKIHLKRTENLVHSKTGDYQTSDTVFIFNDPHDFHKNTVRHLFMGASEDGWKNNKA